MGVMQMTWKTKLLFIMWKVILLHILNQKDSGMILKSGLKGAITTTYVVCFVFYFIISSDLYDAYRGVLLHRKTCWGQDPPEEVMFLRHLYMLTVTSGTFLIAWWRRCAPRITNV
jgi:hypothetical protein